MRVSVEDKVFALVAGYGGIPVECISGDTVVNMRLQVQLVSDLGMFYETTVVNLRVGETVSLEDFIESMARQIEK